MLCRAVQCSAEQYCSAVQGVSNCFQGHRDTPGEGCLHCALTYSSPVIKCSVMEKRQGKSEVKMSLLPPISAGSLTNGEEIERKLIEETDIWQKTPLISDRARSREGRTKCRLSWYFVDMGAWLQGSSALWITPALLALEGTAYQYQCLVLWRFSVGIGFPIKLNFHWAGLLSLYGPSKNQFFLRCQNLALFVFSNLARPMAGGNFRDTIWVF